MNRFFLILFIFCWISISAQIGVSVYPLNNTIGFKTSNQKAVSFELRTSFDISRSTADVVYVVQPEANVIYRIHKQDMVTFYTGIGGGYSMNNVNGNCSIANLLLGIEFYPKASNQNFNLIAELDPNAKFYNGYQTFKMSGLIGVSYYFAKSAKKIKNE